MRDRFGAKKERTWLMRFHTQTAGVSLTAQQPLNNIARVRFRHWRRCWAERNRCTPIPTTKPALPTQEAARIALRTQQIIAYESGVAQTVDPLGGSYFLEKLTLDMENGAFDYFESMRWAAWSRPLRTAFRRKKLLKLPTNTSARLRPRKRSWLA